MATVTVTKDNFDEVVGGDGVVLYARSGALPQAALEELIAKAGQVDMAEVRRSVSESRKAG